MSCVKVKFESYLLLLLFSYDRNSPGYFMLLALGLICDKRSVEMACAIFLVAVTRCCVTAAR